MAIKYENKILETKTFTHQPNSKIMKFLYLLSALFFVQSTFAACRVDTTYSYNFPSGPNSKALMGRAINTYDANNNRTQYLVQQRDNNT